MDDIDLRLLTLERIVNELRNQISSTNLRFLANSTLLNNSGPMAGSTPSSGGNLGWCGGSAPKDGDHFNSSSAIAGTCSNGDSGVAICAKSYRDYVFGESCTIRIYNDFATSVPTFTAMIITPAPDRGQNSYVITGTIW